jgi:radical SAM superfamily enzyme YgiQ (UPF0313 family)
VKVLIVNVVYDSEIDFFEFDPLGLGYLSSFAKRFIQDLEIRIVTTADPSIVFAEPIDLLGLSSTTRFFSGAQHLMRESEARGIPTLLGGAHITLLPDSLPRGVIGIIGEGEKTFVEILSLFKKKQRLDFIDLVDISGIAYRDSEGNLKLTPRRPAIKPLDDIPFPDRDILHMETGGRVDLFTSRGCPYKCAFCASTRLFPGLRFFSADYVVAEIKHLISRYRPVHIKFFDDLFIASRPRLRKLVEKIRDEGIHRKVVFNVNATASMIDEESAKLLRLMNVYTVRMGLESGNPQALNYLKAGSVSVEQNARAVELLVRNGLNPEATFIVGTPGETRDQFNDTLEFVARHPLSRAELFLLTPLPGTPVWDIAREKGLVSDNMDWSILDGVTPLASDVGSIHRQQPQKDNPLEGKIIVSDAMTPDELVDAFQIFDTVRRRVTPRRRLLQSLRRPDLILPYLRLRLGKSSS